MDIALSQTCSNCQLEISWREWIDRVFTTRCKACGQEAYALTVDGGYEVYKGTINRPGDESKVRLAWESAKRLRAEIEKLAGLVPDSYDMLWDAQKKFKQAVYDSWNLVHPLRRELMAKKIVLEEEMDTLWNTDAYEDVMQEHISTLIMLEALNVL